MINVKLQDMSERCQLKKGSFDSLLCGVMELNYSDIKEKEKVPFPKGEKNHHYCVSLSLCLRE